MKGQNLKIIYIIEGIEYTLEELPNKIYEEMLSIADKIEFSKFREDILQNDDYISGIIKTYYPEQIFKFVEE